MKQRNSYPAQVWKQFRKNKPALISFYLLLCFVFIAVFSGFIANKQPYYARYRGTNFYPLFRTLFQSSRVDSTFNPDTKKYEKLQFDITDWRHLKLEKVIWAPIPYSAAQSDADNMNYTSPNADQKYRNADGQLINAPGILRHHLGTNRVGQDVASGLVHGTSIALRVGLISMSIAAFFGILLGAFAGYFGDNRIRLSRGSFILLLPGLFFGYFYGFIVRSGDLFQAFHTGLLQSALQILLSLIIFVFIAFLFTMAGRLLNGIRWLGKKIYLPVDIIISRFIEIFDSIPSLLLIITISSVFVEKSLGLVMGIIGFLAAPHIARLTRAEFLRIRNLDYVQSAKALGYNHLRIMMRHMLPNAIAPVFVYIAFGIATAIIAESSLSFLGIGVPPETVTWGSLLSYARDDYSAWWMTVFPGLAIFITVTMYNLIGEGLRDAMDPRLRTI
jgi:peptide/nickel transport system permease protein